MRFISVEKLNQLQSDPSHIRNICILAHVDHGKTTLADTLVASNGIISNKLAGKLRYLDSRPDEQLRGITMKSSSITLHHSYADAEFVINLIDTPGHVDFASEVSTAVRLSDGAIIVVDVVEGVCPQTRNAMSISYSEGLKPILVLNKIDRLITEMKLSTLDAYVHLTQILEQVNAIMGELFASDLMEREEKEKINEVDGRGISGETFSGCYTVLEEADDSNLYFSPEQGNVLFASAVDGWGFGVKEFARMYSSKLGFSERVLLKTLWGDFYLNAKTKRIMKGAQEKAKKPLFVQLILDNIWTIYEVIVIRKDKDKIFSMAEKLNIKLTTRDLRHTDPKVQLQAICYQWLPLAKACINMICEQVPAPCNLAPEKVERLIAGSNNFSTLPYETQRLKETFLECKSSVEAPIVVFISKMIPIEKKLLPENKPVPPTTEELARRRETARRKHAEKKIVNNLDGGINDKMVLHAEDKNGMDETLDEIDSENILIAFARSYSGILKKGCEVFVLGPKHNPSAVLKHQGTEEMFDESKILKDLKLGKYITRVTIERLYLLMGRELESVDQVPAGNVFGIGGLEEHVQKSATLSSTVACPAFSEITSFSVPILRVALEPKHPNDLQKLITGLKLLNQADASAIVHIQETGEIVLSTAGEVHLERCLEDLRLRYGKVEINVSEPIVPFRETIILPPKVDVVNEVIEKKTEDTSLEIWTANRQCYFEIDAKPLPEVITRLLDKNSDLIKHLYRCHEEKETGEYFQDLSDNVKQLALESVSISDEKRKAVEVFKNELVRAFEDANWKNTVNKIWSFGPRNCGPNILLNETSYKHRAFWEQQYKSVDNRALYDSSMVNGFQLATLAGPLCEEPMMGVCFIIKKWEINEDAQSECGNQNQGYLSGQLMSACKEACRRVFNLRRPRLVTPMYSCSVLANSDVLGKLYAVFGKRQGRVVATESALGFGGQFRVLAMLPVPESFQLAREFRTQTSGLATPQLVFSHWEVIEQDPHWVPSTEEEYLHFGEKADSENRAKKYMNAVRERKGLPVDSQLVTHAEKQRTLSRKK